MREKTFGQKESTKTYTERVGAYGVGFDENSKIPVVMTYLYNGKEGDCRKISIIFLWDKYNETNKSIIIWIKNSRCWWRDK